MTASCGGTSENQNGDNGYGTGAEQNVVLTVEPNATVSGDVYGISLGSGARISTGAGSLVEGADAGISVNGDATIDIAGRVTSDIFGVEIDRGAVTLAEDGAIAVSNATLTDEDFGAAIMLSDDGVVNINGDISTSGLLVQGVYVERRTPNSGRASEITLGQTGTIITDGDFASAIGFFGGEDSNASHRVTVHGAITTTGDHAYGIDAREVLDDEPIRANTAVVMNGVMRTSGRAAHGIFSSISTGSVSPITVSGDLRVSGEGAHGVLLGIARAGEGQVTVSSGGRIMAQGLNGFGIALSPSGESPGVGTANIVIAEGAHVSSARGAAIGMVDDPEMPADPAVGRINTHLTIAGTVAAASRTDTAVLLGAGDDRLTLLPTYDVTGVISGGDGFDTFVLDGAAGTTGDVELFFLNTARVTGFEDIRKVGQGTWNINGTIPSSLTLPAGTVEEGKLMLNVAAAGLDVTVQSGATLGGNGTLRALTVADGGILAPGNSAGTLTMDSLFLNNGSVLDFELGTPGVAAASDRIDVTGNLTLDGLLNVTGAAGFGNGVYTLISYGTLVANNGLALGATPGGYNYNINAGAGTASAVTLEVTGLDVGGSNQYWDGSNTTPGNTSYGRGGAGIWNSANTNWTNAAGSANTAGKGEFAIFYNGTGDVSVVGAQSATGLQFAADGYRLTAGEGGMLDLTGAESRIMVDAGRTATLALPVTVAGDLSRQGAGTLLLSGTVDVDGKLHAERGMTRIVDGGQVTVNGGAALGDGANSAAGLAITGAGSQMHVRQGGLQAGFAGGTGEIVVSDGGHLRVDGRYDLLSVPGGGPLGEDLTRITPVDQFVLGKNGGVARLEVSGGGAVTAGLMVVGEFPSDNSVAATADVLLDGAGSTITLTDNLQLNMGGTFTVSGGAQLRTFTDSSVASETNRAIIAPDRVGWSNTRSTMTVTGEGSSWTSGNVIRIENVGTLVVADNATVSVADAVIVGRGRVAGIDGPSAILNVDSARLQVGGALDIANGGSWAEVNFTNGAIIETAGLMAGTGGTTSGGVSYTAQADILVAGAGTRWTDASGWRFSLGDSGVTTLTVTDGAVIETENEVFFGTGSYDESRADSIVSGGAGFSTSAGFALGEGSNSTGTLLITGAGSHVEVGDSIDVGVAGQGEVTVTEMGRLTASHIHVGRSGGSGIFTIGVGEAGASVSAGGLDLLAGQVRLGTGGVLALDDLGTIGAAGIMSGTGLVAGDLMVNAGGVIAPGHSIGTLNVAGDITFNAGSFFDVEVNAAGGADRLDATGTVTLNGGTVRVLAGAGNYAPATTYTILTAEDGRSGEFGNVTSNLAFLDPSLGYDANNVYLTMTRNVVTFENVGITPNQIAAGSGTESLGMDRSVFDAVLNLSADHARDAFDQLSGEIHASARTAMFEDSRFVRNAVWDRLRGAESDGKGGVWGQGFGSWGHTGSDGNAARLDRSTGGLLMGADGALGETMRLGAVGGYNRTDIDVDRRGSSGRIDSYHLGAYAGSEWGAAAIRTGVAYSWHKVDTTRGIAFPGISDTVRANYDASTFQAFGELGYALDLDGSLMEPFANIAYVRAHSDAFNETGGDAKLGGGKAATDVTFSTLGLRTATDFAFGNAQATLWSAAGWRHAFGDRLPVTTMRYLAGSDAFTIAGLPVTRDAVTADAGFDVAISGTASLSITYSGQIGARLSDHTARASLMFKF